MKVSSGRTEASMPEPGSGSETIDGLDKVMYYTHTHVCFSYNVCCTSISVDFVKIYIIDVQLLVCTTLHVHMNFCFN